MQRTDYVFKVANRSKTESQNSKQNHKTQNRITKRKTESQNPKQKHKTQNRITNPKQKHKTQNRITESQNPKQNHKTQNRITKPETQNSKQNHKTQNRITPVVPSKTIPDSRTKWAKCRPVFRPKRLKNKYIYIPFGAAHTYMAYIGEFPRDIYSLGTLDQNAF